MEHKKEQKAAISITVGSEIVKLRLEEFIYAESQRNYQYIYLENGETEKTRMACAELYDQLTERKEFVRVGASYIVNLKYVLKVPSSDVKLTDGRMIHIPRRVAEDMKRQYRDFFSINKDRGGTVMNKKEKLLLYQSLPIFWLQDGFAWLRREAKPAMAMLVVAAMLLSVLPMSAFAFANQSVLVGGVEMYSTYYKNGDTTALLFACAGAAITLFACDSKNRSAQK